jgi:carbamoyltransferase
MKKNCQGVIHIDGTARPQLVSESDNPSYYKIIEAFYRKTGLPCIVNTSYNMHEEPIVCTPGDAVRAFLQGHLDYLAIGSFIAMNEEAIQASSSYAREAPSEEASRISSSILSSVVVSPSRTNRKA